MKRLIMIITTILLSLDSYNCVSQVCKEVIINSKDDLDIQLNNIISKEYHIDPATNIRIIFLFKIDSLGEIHSAHIRYSQNFNTNKYYAISKFIEECVKAPFLFSSFKDDFSGKYVLVDVPYFSK